MHHQSSHPPTLLSLFILTLAVASATAQKAAQCFYPPNGKTLVPQPDDTPCNPEGKNSVCCAPEDICLSNGLCWRADINRLHRGSCTDPTFSHPACTSICTGPNEHPFGFADVLECTPYANQNWYCGVGNSSKCNTDAAFKLTDGFFADYRNQTAGAGGAGGAAAAGGEEKTVTVTVTATATVTQKGGEVSCPVVVAATTPVSAATQTGTTQAQGLISTAGDDGQDVSSAQVVAANTATTMPASATVVRAGTTTASGNATANGTAAATYKPGNGASSSRGGMMSAVVVLAGLGVLGVMLAM